MMHKSPAASVEQHSSGSYIKSIVYGGLDGVITTFAIVSGGAGASLLPGTLLVLGVANLIADAFSMGIGDYTSSKAEDDFAQRMKDQAEHLYTNEKEKSLAVATSFFKKSGLEADSARQVAEKIIQHKDLFAQIYLLAHDVGEDRSSALKSGLYTFSSFVIFGFVPLVTYVVLPYLPMIEGHVFGIASVLTALTLFSLGVTKSLITQQHFIRAGLEMVGIGGIAAFAAYSIGHSLSLIVS